MTDAAPDPGPSPPARPAVRRLTLRSWLRHTTRRGANRRAFDPDAEVRRSAGAEAETAWTRARITPRRLLALAATIAVLPLIGTAGFLLTGGDEWSLIDAFYMSVITLTTVGYQEVHPLTDAGRIFVSAYLVVALGVFLYCLAQIGELVVRSGMADWLQRSRMDASMKVMKDHYVVCGFGRMGRWLCRQLAASQVPFTVVDRDASALEPCQREGWHWVVGEATEDATLEEAGLRRARGVAAVLPTDADNLYVVLSARLISPRAQIIARASDDTGAAKIRRAGANRVVNVYETGASKMAQLLVNPNLDDFVEIFANRGSQVDLAELVVAPDSAYAGKALADTDFRARGIIIVGIRKPTGELILPPPSSAVLQPDDCLIAIGESDAVQRLIQTT